MASLRSRYDRLDGAQKRFLSERQLSASYTPEGWQAFFGDLAECNTPRRSQKAKYLQ